MAVKNNKKSSGNVDRMFDFEILRELRKREGWTIDELSTKAGISPAVISKLERNQTSAELNTLFSLSRAFGMNVTDLLMLAESRTSHRASESSHRSGTFSFREIKYGNIRALLGEAKAGGKVSNPEIHHDDLEVCWVLRGMIKLQLPHEHPVIKVGECVQFDAILEHSYEVIEDCQILILHLKKGKRF
ncbi:MAG: helix-turn-helix domain-containing protein [bacterium]|jgi:transcriptional regulator with XRE-family HTH domain